MAHLPQALQTKIQTDPNAALNLIIRVIGDLDVRTEQVQKRGFRVKRTFILINGLAVSGIGTKVESLVKEEWVISIEEDRPVRTL